MSRFRDILIHIICCAGFLCIPVFLARAQAGINFLSLNTLRDVIGYSLTVGYFYLNFYYLIPRYYLQRRYELFVLFTVICFMLVMGLPKLIIPVSHRPADILRGWGATILTDINHNLFRFLTVFLISLMLRIRDQWKRAREGKTLAELAFLKSQIQPHFLYNTLNTIYALAIEGAKETPDAVARLSGMMRYVTDESALDFVPLSRELSYIESYVTLQELRFGKTVGISCIITGEAEGYEIAPMMLIPFVENAFKHGINPEEQSGIVVRINISYDVLRMEVRNRLVHTRGSEQSGLGLANTRSRLKLLYAGRYELTSSAVDDIYNVSLTLNLV